MVSFLAAALLLALAARNAQGVRKRHRRPAQAAGAAVELPDGAKLVAGVPVYNYDLAFSGKGASLSENGTAENAEERWVVVLKAEESDESIAKVCSASSTACMSAGHPNSGGVAFAEVSKTASGLERLLKTVGAQVAFVEPNVVVSMVPGLDAKTEEEQQQKQQLPSSSREYTWGLERIGAPKRVHEGQGAHVYVLDTGCRTTHTDFNGRAIATIDTTSGTIVECNGDAACVKDVQGHGTHCAGTVAGTTYGVAPKATVHAGKVLGDLGSGQLTWILSGIDWVVTKGIAPRALSMSLGVGAVVKSFETAIDAAATAGVTVVVAGGNDNRDSCRFTPAYVTTAITVGATNINDDRAYFSNYGSCTNLWAPGRDIESLGITSDTATATMSGTSMACPHVAGGVALLLGANPSWTPEQVLEGLKSSSEKWSLHWLKSDDTNDLLWVSADAAPVHTPPPSCPAFAERQLADEDGDCACPAGKICRRGEAKCPTSNGVGGWGSTAFSHDCADCACIEQETLPCPAFALFTEANLLGDCSCRSGEICSRPGGTTCPSGSQGVSAFMHDCKDCNCNSAPSRSLALAWTMPAMVVALLLLQSPS